MSDTSERFTAAVLVGVLIAMLSACTTSHEPARDPDGRGQSAPPRSAWQQTLDRIRPDGSVDVETALAAFTLAVGPVPGVNPPQGPPATIGSGTIAVNWVLDHWHELSAEQQAAVAAALGETTPGSPAIRPAFHAALSRAPSRPRGDSGEDSVLPWSPNWRCHLSDSPGAEPYRTGVDHALSYLNTQLRNPVDPPIAVVANTRPVKPDGQPAAAYAVPCSLGVTVKPGRPFLGCTIHVNPGVAAAAVRLIMVHEVVHCYVANRVFRKNPRPGFPPAWFNEGLAEWIAWTMVPPDAASGTDQFWREYLRTPTRPLFQRSYDAAGFFARLTETGSNVWSAIDRMLGAWRSDPEEEQWNQAAWLILRPSRAFLESWGSGFVRGRYPGAAWDITGPGIPAVRPSLPTITLKQGGPTQSVVTLKATAQAVVLQLDAEVVSIAAPGAFGRITVGNGADATLDVASSQLYCTLPAARCTCPPGSPGEGTPFTVLGGKRQHLGFTGGLSGATVTLSGTSLDQACRAARPRIPDTCPTTALVAERVPGSWELSAVNTAPDGVYTDKEFQICSYLGPGSNPAAGKQVRIDLYPQIRVRVPSTRQTVINLPGVDRAVIHHGEVLGVPFIGVLVEAGGRSMAASVCDFDGRGGGRCDEAAALALTRHILRID